MSPGSRTVLLATCAAFAFAACSGGGNVYRSPAKARMAPAAVAEAPVPPAFSPAPVARAPSDPSPFVAPPPPTPPAPEKPTASTLREAVAALRRDAESGKDADLAPVADLLGAMEAALASPGDEPRIERVPALETAERARFGSGSAFSTVGTYFVEGADPEAVRAAHLDYDRLVEWTGNAGTKIVGREGRDVLGASDSMRKVFGMEFGARWKFRAHPFERGAARVYVSRKIDTEESLHMRATKAVFVAFPEAGGVRVAEANLSALDYETNPILAPIAVSMAMKDMRKRFEGVRAHWREYVR